MSTHWRIFGLGGPLPLNTKIARWDSPRPLSKMETRSTMEMWKTAAPPMENRYSRSDGKAAGFPTARKHRFPQLRRYSRLRTFPQRLLLRISFLSDPDRKRKRKQKKKWERHPRLKPKAALPLCYGKVFKTASLHPSNQRERFAWEIIRAAPGKAVTNDFLAHFQPLSAHFFERADW